MRTRSTVVGVLVLLALAACGGEGRLEGSVVVQPGSTSTLEIEGQAETTLELDQRGDQAVVMVDGGTERRLEIGASVRLTFDGAKKLVFRNEGKAPARIHYRATSAGGVSSSLEQR